MGTLNKPGIYDCYSKLDPDEPHFVLMGRDPVAWATVLMWVAFREAIFANEDKDKLEEAKSCARQMFEFAAQRGKEKLILAFKHASAKMPRVREVLGSLM